MSKRFAFMFVLLIIVLSGCSWLYQSGTKNGSSSEASDNLVVPSFDYMNQDGESFGTKDLEGQLWVANMVFTRCPTVCTTMTPNFMVLQNTLAEEGLDVRLVSFTVDPEFDNPERLRKYGENNGADFTRWTFVTGYSLEEMEAFALEAFKAPVMQVPEKEDIMHTTKFFLVNEEGKIIGGYNGLTPDPDPIIKDIKAHLESKSNE